VLRIDITHAMPCAFYAAWDDDKHLCSLKAIYIVLASRQDLRVTHVLETFAWETTYSSWLFTLLAMSFLSLGFSLALFLKSRAVEKIPKSLAATIFSKTFNVFDPFSEHRRMFQSDFFFLLTFLGATLLVVSAFVAVLVTGLFVELAIILLCLGLMMISEATEAYSTANTLLKAVKKQTKFGQGDIYVLALVKKGIGKLSAYYVLLSVLFVTLFFTVPYLFPALTLAFLQFAGPIMNSATGIPVLGPFFAALLVALFTVAVFEAGKRAKAAFFNFLPSDLSQTDEAMPSWKQSARGY